MGLYQMKAQVRFLRTSFLWLGAQLSSKEWQAQILLGIDQSCYMTATNQAQAVWTDSLCTNAKIRACFSCR